MQGSKRAKALRRKLTDAEHRLWLYLRDRRLRGHKFRRQVPIGPFVVDFVCMSARLIIEVDGGQHARRVHAMADVERDRRLRLRGFRVLRFWSGDVLANTEGALHAIARAIATPRGVGHPVDSD